VEIVNFGNSKLWKCGNMTAERRDVESGNDTFTICGN